MIRYAFLIFVASCVSKPIDSTFKMNGGWFESSELPLIKCKHMEVFSCGAKLTECSNGSSYWCVRNVRER